MKLALTKRAYSKAAEWLREDVDANDLPVGLTEVEEEELREFIHEIADELEVRARYPRRCPCSLDADMLLVRRP